MLRVLMGTMRGLRGLDPCGRRSDGMGIPLLPFCPNCSDSPSIGTCGGDIIELPYRPLHAENEVVVFDDGSYYFKMFQNGRPFNLDIIFIITVIIILLKEARR